MNWGGGKRDEEMIEIKEKRRIVEKGMKEMSENNVEKIKREVYKNIVGNEMKDKEGYFIRN